MTITPEPKRPYRSAWWAKWNGQEHYIGHDRWIEFDRATTTLWYVDRDPSEATDTPRAHKSVALLRKTGIILIQHDGPNGEFKRWARAYKISELEVRGPGFWIRCKLTPLED
jgi:hypothetical protein